MRKPEVLEVANEPAVRVLQRLKGGKKELPNLERVGRESGGPVGGRGRHLGCGGFFGGIGVKVEERSGFGLLFWGRLRE